MLFIRSTVERLEPASRKARDAFDSTSCAASSRTCARAPLLPPASSAVRPCQAESARGGFAEDADRLPSHLQDFTTFRVRCRSGDFRHLHRLCVGETGVAAGVRQVDRIIVDRSTSGGSGIPRRPDRASSSISPDASLARGSTPPASPSWPPPQPSRRSRPSSSPSSDSD